MRREEKVSVFVVTVSYIFILSSILKVRQFQNEFMKSSFLEQKIVKISALTTQGRHPYNFSFFFWEKRWLHKLILKLSDLNSIHLCKEMGGASCRNTRIRENARRLTKNESSEAGGRRASVWTNDHFRGWAVRFGGPGGAGRRASLNFGRYVNPVQIRGADYAH